MEEAPAVKEEAQDSDSEVACMSANGVAVKVEDPLHFVELKSELEVNEKWQNNWFGYESWPVLRN
jgi:hypothetical protein